MNFFRFLQISLSRMFFPAFLLSPQYFFDRKYRNNNKNPLCGYSAVRNFSTFSKEREHFEQTWHKWSNPQKYWEDNTVIVLTRSALAFGSRSAPRSHNNLLNFGMSDNLSTGSGIFPGK